MSLPHKWSYPTLLQVGLELHHGSCSRQMLISHSVQISRQGKVKTNLKCINKSKTNYYRICSWREKSTSFCRHAAWASSSSMRSLAADSSSTFSYFTCWAKPNPMHLKGELEPRDLVAFFSDLFDNALQELALEELMERPSGLTCSAMASNALNWFKITQT